MTWFELGAIFPLGLLVLTFVLAFYRVARGPSLPDRALAFDVLAAASMAWIAIYAVLTGTGVLLDLILILAFLSFLGTVGLAYYIALKGERP